MQLGAEVQARPFRLRIAITSHGNQSEEWDRAAEIPQEEFHPPHPPTCRHNNPTMSAMNNLTSVLLAAALCLWPVAILFLIWAL